jgi:hypothetical protein
MKHILNDISSEERNNILEQHSGGKKMVIENFDKLVNNKLGTVKTFEEGKVIKEDNFQGGGLNATGRGVGYYRDQLGGVVKQNFTFGKDSMKTGSDIIDITKKEFVDLVNQLNLILSDSSIGQTTVTVTGGASAASKTPGYDNKALALRRANNLVTQLRKYIPGIDKKIKFTTKGVVDETATVVNSDKAYAAQFVKVSFQTSTITDIRQTIESDNTTVDPFERGGKRIGGDDNDNDGDKFPIPSTKLKRVCVKIPENRVADFRLKVREFKAEFGLGDVPFGVYDV